MLFHLTMRAKAYDHSHPVGETREENRGKQGQSPAYDTYNGADDTETITDTYKLDTFGRSVSSSGSTPNPYRFGGAWGYITDPSGMLQLGARFYWPEVGRFISQDPIGEGSNWYAYATSNPVVRKDPTGLECSDQTPDQCCNGGDEECDKECLTTIAGSKVGHWPSADQLLADYARCLEEIPLKICGRGAMGVGARSAGGKGGLGDFVNAIGGAIGSALGWIRNILGYG